MKTKLLLLLAVAAPLVGCSSSAPDEGTPVGGKPSVGSKAGTPEAPGTSKGMTDEK